MEKLSEDYIAGFVDGEGCFSLKYRVDRKRGKEYFYWTTEFAIVLREDDEPLLESIRTSVGCGSVTTTPKTNQARFSVQGIHEQIAVILPLFEKHRLHGKKANDFLLWAEAVRILEKHRAEGLNTKKGARGFQSKPLTEGNAKRLEQIRNEMLAYKSKREGSFRWGSR